jgi:hypothetical protein
MSIHKGCSQLAAVTARGEEHMRRNNVPLGFVLLCLFGCTTYGQDTPLKTEIKLPRTEVNNHETFSVATAVRNTSTTDQMLDVWSCSYPWQWASDNPTIQVGGIACQQNVHGKIKLRPGEAYERTVPLYVELPIDKISKASAAFRLGFEEATQVRSVRPFPDNLPIWSNYVIINVRTRLPAEGADGGRSLHATRSAETDHIASGENCQIRKYDHLLPLMRGTLISAHASELGFNHTSHMSSGTVTITNISGRTVTGPFQLVLDSLTSEVTMSNATGTYGCMPYITFKGVGSLAPGQSASVTTRFSNPAWKVINFDPHFYRGNMN